MDIPNQGLQHAPKLDPVVWAAPRGEDIGGAWGMRWRMVFPDQRPLVLIKKDS